MYYANALVSGLDCYLNSATIGRRRRVAVLAFEEERGGAEMTKIMSAISTKGGSGKSTTIRILAAQLASEGKKVVIIDTDPQGSCAQWVQNAENKGRKIENLGFLAINQLTDIEPTVAKLRGKVDYILLDVQGAATAMILPVAKVSDLIILPWAVTQDDWEALKKSYVILDRIRTDDASISPIIVISNNRITAPDLNHPYVKNRFDVAKKMNIRAAETLIWKRTPYTDMLIKYGSIPQIESTNESIVKAKAEHQAFTHEMLSMLSEAQAKVA
ncbi:AAA family ATPase [Sinorhizobium fredii]|uniref:AAA family ATPase n=1 Tax=Rhizobium fredii TaxID=380 RepID=UPI003515C622